MTHDTMEDVDHTHPHGDRSVAHVFRRGSTVVTDGGASGSTPESSTAATTDDDAMADVSHTPPHGDGANRVFERGADRQVDDWPAAKDEQ